MKPTIGTKRAQQAGGHWKRWYREQDWRYRAEAYDAHLDQTKREAEAQKWKARGAQLVEDQYEAAQAMRKKALQMLAFPLAQQTVDGKDGLVTIEPARWNMNTVARLMKVAVEMARLAAGLPTGTTHNTHFEFDITQCSDEQLERIAHGENPISVLANAGEGRAGT